MTNSPTSIAAEICGVKMPNPFILSSAPPTGSYEMIARAFEAGWGGAIIKTLPYDLKMNIPKAPFMHAVWRDQKIVGFNNFDCASRISLEEWAPGIRRLKRDFPDRFLAANILHTTTSTEKEWKEMAVKCEEAGVDAIELNLSCPHVLAEVGVGSAVGEKGGLAGLIAKWVREVTSIPIIAKLPAVPNVESLVEQVYSNVDVISGVNTILGIAGIDLETEEPYPNVEGYSSFSGCSGHMIKPLGLRTIAKIAKMETGLPLSGVGGIGRWSDAVEYIFLGASTVQVCTAVLLNGYRIIENLTSGLQNYMERRCYKSIEQMVGKVLPKLVSTWDLSTRKIVSSVDRAKCIKDGLCYVVCNDGGHQAITLDEERYPVIDADRCEGCSLCKQVCPVEGCIQMVPK